MSAKILASLSSRTASFAFFERGALSQLATYDNDERAWSAFDALLHRYPDTPVYLMVDTVEEEYRTEALPHVRGRARREMLKRKLSQMLRTAPYRATWLQGRETGAEAARGKRRDDVYLFLALNSGDLLHPYLERIQIQRAPLAGIYLLPLVTQALAARLKCDTPGALLVSRQQGGLRQSFFLNGRLRISRLTPFDPLGDPASAELYAEEIEKSRLFLYNSRQLPRDARLTAQVLDFDGSLTQLPAQLPQETNFSYQRIGFNQACAALGVAPSALPRDTEALHLYLLGKYPPPASLAAPRLTSDFTLHQLRLGLYAASATLAGVALLWSSYNIYRGYANQDATQRAIADTARYGAQYEQAARQFPTAPVSADNLRKAVEVTRQLKQFVRTPESFMTALSQTLDVFPQIELKRIEWQYASTTPSAQQAASTEPANWQQRGEVEAEIHPFNGDYRSALALIERFAATLRTQAPVAEVTIVKLPVNLDSSSTLSGSTQDNLDTAPGAAQFKLSIVLKRTL